MKQWARTAWAMALLFATLPLAGRLFLGGWGFDTALGLACLCCIAGAYLHIRGRRPSRVLPDSAAMLDRAIRLASSGRTKKAMAVLSEAIRLDPALWQAFQYRGELALQDPNSVPMAVQDFSEAIRLAPGEAHLYILRAQAYTILRDEESAQRDYETASVLVRGGGDR